MDKEKVALIAIGLGAAYWFYGRKTQQHNKSLDSELEKVAKDKHYDINLVHLIRNQFVKFGDAKGVDKKTFIEWIGKLFHIPAGAEKDHELTTRLSLLFDLYDTDKNGRLNAVEFLNGLAFLSNGSIIDKANFMFDAWDLDKDGFLTQAELEKAYRQAVIATSKLTAGEGLKYLVGHRFSTAVAHTANSVLSDLTQEGVKKWIDEHVKQLFVLIDDNKDGRISREEWLKHVELVPLFRQLDFSEEYAHVTIPKESYKVEIACSKYKATLGEGPHWDANTKRLHYIDIVEKKVLSLDPVTEDLESYDVGQMIGCLAPVKGKSGSFLVALQDGLAIFNTKTRSKEYFLKRDDLEPGKPKNRFNDGKVDSQGRLYVGTMTTAKEKGGEGSFYRINRDGTHVKIMGDVAISNGITWSRDETKLYYIDTPTQKVVRFNYDKHTGNLSDKKVVIEVPVELGCPDGMTIDTDGNLWIALWGGSKVSKWNPYDGRLLQMIPFPAKNITSVCFGGPNLDILYVTSATVETDVSQFPEAGCVFSVTGLGVKGFLLNDY